MISCWLDCKVRDARIATLPNDNSLRKKIAVLWTKLNGVMITPGMLNCTGCRLEGVKMPSSDKLCPLVPFSCFASNSALRSYITYTHNNTQHSELPFSIEKIDALT